MHVRARAHARTHARTNALTTHARMHARMYGPRVGAKFILKTASASSMAALCFALSKFDKLPTTEHVLCSFGTILASSHQCPDRADEYTGSAVMLFCKASDSSIGRAAIRSSTSTNKLQWGSFVPQSVHSICTGVLLGMFAKTCDGSCAMRF